jgi:hypothetical protein
MHQPIPEQGRWLARIVRGFYAYHAVPTNMSALRAFRYYIEGHWVRTLRRRSQKDRFAWDRIEKLANDLLPPPKILHPWPQRRFAVSNWACTDLCGGRRAITVPTAIEPVPQRPQQRGPTPAAQINSH